MIVIFLRKVSILLLDKIRQCGIIYTNDLGRIAKLVIGQDININTVQKLRKSTGLSQRKFAEFFDIPVRTLQDWEQGRRNPPEYVLKMMNRIWKEETL